MDPIQGPSLKHGYEDGDKLYDNDPRRQPHRRHEAHIDRFELWQIQRCKPERRARESNDN